MHQESPEASPALPQSKEPDRGAVCALYFPQVRAYLKSRGLGREDLQDSLQEVFLRLLVALKAKRVDRGRIPGWLIVVARNVSVDLIRGRRRAAVQLNRSHNVSVVDPPPGADEGRRIVRAAIARLPAPYREALMMSHYEQMEAAEIASRLGISRNAVYLRLFQARHLLFHQLKGLLYP